MTLRDIGLDSLHQSQKISWKEDIFAHFLAFLHHSLHKKPSNFIEQGLLFLIL